MTYNVFSGTLNPTQSINQSTLAIIIYYYYSARKLMLSFLPSFITREPLSVSGTGFFWVTCPSCHPTVSVKALKQNQSSDTNQEKSPVSFSPSLDSQGQGHSIAPSATITRQFQVHDHLYQFTSWRSSIHCCQTTSLEQSCYTCPSTWFVLGHLLPKLKMYLTVWGTST